MKMAHLSGTNVSAQGAMHGCSQLDRNHVGKGLMHKALRLALSTITGVFNFTSREPLCVRVLIFFGAILRERN